MQRKTVGGVAGESKEKKSTSRVGGRDGNSLKILKKKSCPLPSSPPILVPSSTARSVRLLKKWPPKSSAEAEDEQKEKVCLRMWMLNLRMCVGLVLKDTPFCERGEEEKYRQG